MVILPNVPYSLNMLIITNKHIQNHPNRHKKKHINKQINMKCTSISNLPSQCVPVRSHVHV